MNAGGLTAVLFDVGNVLIEWDPRHLYRKIFICPDGTPDRARIEWFLTEVCSQAWNEEQDRGRTLAAATASLTARWPNYAGEIAAFYDRFQEMIPGAIAESREVFDHFKDRGLPVYGLTNFSRETFAATRARFDVLRRFDAVLVSGKEGLIKPDPAIFRRAAARFDLHPPATLFIDDSARNIAAARALGFQTHHFAGGPALIADLRGRGLMAFDCKRIGK
ncbi:MAG: HAD family phosphatase [Pseudomonadota bacterium]|nr:HAD family phosphatase [Pseudomonadota bacterium]